MGLFSNNKKPCPLCGSPTPRLLATKVEDMPLCKECAGKIDLPDGALDRMTLAQLEQYMAFYEENAALRETFSEDYRYGFGLLSGALVVDSAHRLLRIKAYDSALVFGPENLQSFRILEDSDPLFTGNADGLTCHHSDVPDKVEALIPSIDQFMRRKQDFEHMEEMHRMMDRDRDHDHDHPRPPRPEFVCTPPVRKFRLELTFSHPYWKSFTQEIGAPDFSSQYPSAEDYLREYEDKVEALRELASRLQHIINPDAPQRREDDPQPAAAAAAPAPAADPVAEIQKYKLLFDAGVLTEEEFAAKKKQLLGI